MKYKRFIAKDSKEAADMIRAEMGSDAIIVSTKNIKKKGIKGWFSKPEVEVVAVMEEDHSKSLIQVETKKDIEELKSLVSVLTEKVANMNTSSNQETKAVEKSIFDVYTEYLTNRRVQAPIAKKIVEIASRQITLTEENFEHVINAMKLVTADYMGDGKTIDADRGSRPRIYVFLGPTGVGKTTTLSKLAASLVLAKKTVGIITLDTFRIAAVEQIKTYSTILEAPLEVAYDEEELKNAIHKLREMDYILVDTAGRGHKLGELKEDYDMYSSCIKNGTYFLLLNVNTDYRELKSIVQSYGFLSDYRLLFTKLDEADSLANILNLRVLTGMPLSYFATGQSVPDDLILADKKMVVDNIFKLSEGGNGSS